MQLKQRALYCGLPFVSNLLGAATNFSAGGSRCTCCAGWVALLRRHAAPSSVLFATKTKHSACMCSIFPPMNAVWGGGGCSMLTFVPKR